jgi:hypothetical protein
MADPGPSDQTNIKCLADEVFRASEQLIYSGVIPQETVALYAFKFEGRRLLDTETFLIE